MTTLATLTGTLTSLRFVDFLPYTSHYTIKYSYVLRSEVRSLMCGLTFAILARGVYFMTNAACQRNKISGFLVDLGH